MATGVVSWSQTAASNATADTNVNWAEGMAPSAVNNSARAEMASVAMYRDDNAGSLTTSGTSTAYTVSTNQGFGSLSAMNGQSIRVMFDQTNGASPTLNVDSLGAKAIQTATGTAVSAGAILANSVYDLVYDNSNGVFVLVAPPAAALLAPSGTAMLFQQTSAPTGWTKSTTHNNKALRIVSGTASSGGSTGFTNVLTSRTIGQANLPSYTLSNTLAVTTTMTVSGSAAIGVAAATPSTTVTSGGATTVYNTPSYGSLSAASVVSGSVTSGGSGTAMDFDVQYVDVIIATKD